MNLPLAPVRMLGDMIRIRVFEERCAELYGQSKIRGFLHLYVGQEAIAAGIVPQLSADDALLGTYREHGHALIRGVPAGQIMAEMFGKATGCSGGRGGSMHLFDASRHFYGGNAIVGGHLPVAAGLALADVVLGRISRVTACFFGEGAVAEGEFHEAMNIAALWDLPVLFCCENNLYAMGTSLTSSESQTDLALKAAAYEMPSWVVDGMDPLAVAESAHRAINTIRGGGGPVFLELRTYRFRAHSMFDPELYRNADEVEQWKKLDPIQKLSDLLLEREQVTAAEVDEAWAAAKDETQDAVDFAEAAPLESVDTLEQHTYAGTDQ